MLSRDCDGCPQNKACSKRFRMVVKGEIVYCPDGTAHLVDSSSMLQAPYACLNDSLLNR